MTFLENILAELASAPALPFLQEIHGNVTNTATGKDLLELIAQARTFLSQKGLKKGDRCALLAPNSIRWIALDLAIMAEGLIVVPLYSRQAAAELVAMMKDCSPGAHLLRRPNFARTEFWKTGPKPHLNSYSKKFSQRLP